MYDAPEAFPKVNGPPDYGRPTKTFLMRCPYFTIKEKKNKNSTACQLQNNLRCHASVSKYVAVVFTIKLDACHMLVT